MFAGQVKVQVEKSTLIILTTKEKSRLWREINTFLPFLLSEVAFSIFRWKMLEPNPSKKNIEVLIQAPTQK